MKKTRNNKGFTLAELLIVVAIIAVLVAVAIPVFNAQLEKSKIATDQANARSAYGEAIANYLTDGTTNAVTLGKGTYTVEIDADDINKITVTGNAASTQSSQYEDGIIYDGSDFSKVSG